MRYFISAPGACHGVVKKLTSTLDAIGHVNAYGSGISDFTADITDATRTEAAFNLIQSIRDAELFILVCPCTRITATELGSALSSRYGKRIIVWSETGADFTIGATPYYFHPTVTRFTGSIDKLLEYIQQL